MNNKKAVFPDTNILLHFRHYDQIDWPKLMQAQEVDLVFPPITLRELHKHKTFHPVRTIKRRAGEISSKLDKVFEIGPRTEVRPNVFVTREKLKPTIDFEENGLDPADQDHQLIGSILFYRQHHPDTPVVFATNDVGAKHTAQDLGIDVWMPTDDLAAKDEPDPLEKEVSSLRRENAELKRRVPKVAVVFQGGATLLSIEKHAPFTVLETDFTEEMKKVFQEHWPVCVENPHLPAQAGKHQKATELHNFCDSYNGQLYPAMAKYNADVKTYHEWVAGIIRV